MKDGGKLPFHLILIKPSHYDDDGYVIQWVRSAIPSNTLAALYGLATDCVQRQVLGPDVEIIITAYDETNTRIRIGRIINQIRRAGGLGLVGLVGVQSNQFPRALDIARPLRDAGIQVCIGGFHVSGSLAMLPGLSPELIEARDMGISLFAGEAEDQRLDAVLRDAFQGKLEPMYNHMNDLPGLEGAPPPLLPATRIKHTAGSHTSFDAGRGCPYQCSFCTIINVQGRKSRFRSADDVEHIIRANIDQGIRSLFITDDNFARNKNWEAIFDRIIYLRMEEGLKVHLMLQVDTLCHKIPNFIEKAAKAGVRRVFIGLESINPDSLIGAKKRQNKITEYRKMLLAWKAERIITYAGYILGFPADTPETIARDIEIIKRELPVDLMEFFYLTPLPGSEDHQKMYKDGTWMEPDLNSYDLNHLTQNHPIMSNDEWRATYRRAWEVYYSDDHVEKILKRVAGSGMSIGKVLFYMLWFNACVTCEKVHPLDGGYFRRKYRTDRRPGLPLENPFVFYPKWIYGLARTHVHILSLAWKWGRYRAALKKDPEAGNYTDLSLQPVTDAELDELELFAVTDGGRDAVERARRLGAHAG